MTLTSNGAAAGGERWAPGRHFGLPVPADAGTLLADGPGFLTRAFRASGALAADNAVRGIVGWEEFHGGGTGKKLLLTVAYDSPGPGLPEELFVKFSRNFDNELWDSGRHHLVSEVDVAILSRSPDFPVPVPAVLFADVDPETSTGLIVTERIPYGRDGVEPHYPKCLDYTVPDQVGHYAAILRGLARLSGAHRAGRLPSDVDSRFPYDRERATAPSGRQAPEAKILQWAGRLFDFVDRYPQLFPEHARSAAFREQFLADIPDVLAAGDRITKVLHGNPDLIAFAHWNANIDNCFFRPGPDGRLEAGFLDWANAGQLSVAQSVSGAISCAEPSLWDDHLDDLLTVFIEEYAASGGPQLDLDEVRLHVLLIAASGLSHSMGAPIALAREVGDLDALEGPRDRRLVEHENARIQLHMTTKMLSLWRSQRLGDLVRAL
ncbi:hypothetical protein [Trujillonella endophytica]|uniref:Phosphotransferase enzyme family protein n=1 Tax=Trujillonella endophytica TaxID=673521 RepID=A0A1H8WHT0_9ACTN|nr:hypothetical protein [Trujillella endophytica]SEP27244.1 hypothetical protein SAMN05660991_04437 [Trujillella endophytica]